MKLFVVAIRDRAADCFGRPFFIPSKGGAIRSFGDEVNRVAADNELNKHPEDFDLFLLGTFDDSDASFECHQPEQLAVGKDMLRTQGE